MRKAVDEVEWVRDEHGKLRLFTLPEALRPSEYPEEIADMRLLKAMVGNVLVHVPVPPKMTPMEIGDMLEEFERLARNAAGLRR